MIEAVQYRFKEHLISHRASQSQQGVGVQNSVRPPVVLETPAVLNRCGKCDCPPSSFPTGQVGSRLTGLGSKCNVALGHSQPRLNGLTGPAKQRGRLRTAPQSFR